VNMEMGDRMKQMARSAGVSWAAENLTAEQAKRRDSLTTEQIDRVMRGPPEKINEAAFELLGVSSADWPKPSDNHGGLFHSPPESADFVRGVLTGERAP